MTQIRRSNRAELSSEGEAKQSEACTSLLMNTAGYKPGCVVGYMAHSTWTDLV